MGLCTFVLINFVISYETSIYENTESDISSEYRGNLIKLYEYLKWDEKYGLFKFLFAPFNVIQFPFTILILFFKDDSVNLTKIYTKVLYFPVCLFYFFFYFIYQTYHLFLAIFHILFIYPFKSQYQRMQKNLKNSLKRALLGPLILSLYYLRDFGDFWYYAYRAQIIFNDEMQKKKSITEFTNSFESMIDIIIQKMNSQSFSIVSVNDLIESWKLFTLKQIHEKNDKVNRYKHHTFLIDKKFGRRNTIAHIHKQISIDDENKTEHITFKNQLEKNIEFLKRFADEEGFIDKNISQNLFIKDSYYEDDYFECIYYFRYKYFKELIAYFDKNNKKDTNKLRGVYINFLKINEKFKILKTHLRNTEFKENQIKAMSFGISSINMYFARLEELLNNEHIKEINDKLNKKNQKGKNRVYNNTIKSEKKENSSQNDKMEDEK